jgi:hypothetical protein
MHGKKLEQTPYSGIIFKEVLSKKIKHLYFTEKTFEVLKTVFITPVTQ